MAARNEHLQDAAERVLVQARDTVDPIERAKHLEAAMEDLGDLTAQFGAARRAAVHEARQRMSAVQLAEALGVTRARVYQILDGR